MGSDRPYPYAGLPITPAILAENILRLHKPGTVARRNDLIQAANQHHLDSAGWTSTANLNTQGKKALQTLESVGKIEKTGGFGYWRIVRTDLDGLAEEAAEVVALEQPDDSVRLRLSYEMVLGGGSESIYAYYFPTYRRFAERCGEAVWPIKVGRTAGDVAARVLSQVGTALPELPTIAFVYKTDHSVAVEAMLHGILLIRGRKVDAPGAEWFTTTPKERDCPEFG